MQVLLKNRTALSAFRSSPESSTSCHAQGVPRGGGAASQERDVPEQGFSWQREQWQLSIRFAHVNDHAGRPRHQQWGPLWQQTAHNPNAARSTSEDPAPFPLHHSFCDNIEEVQGS